jgi:hypothetical protein
VNASGKWFLPDDGSSQKDEFSDVSTPELLRRATEQLAVEASQREAQGRTDEIARFLAATPNFPNDPRSAGMVEAQLRNILAARGSYWPKWNRADWDLCIDQLTESGAIVIPGYVRKNATVEECETMSLAELRKRAGGF